MLQEPVVLAAFSGRYFLVVSSPALDELLVSSLYARKTLFESIKNTLRSASKLLSETPIDAIDHVSVMVGLPSVGLRSVAGRVSYGRGGVVLEIGGWWPVLAGLFQEMHRTSLDHLVLVPKWSSR